MTKPMILVVEDEWMVAEDIRSSLDAEGYATFVATSGEEALVLAERIKPILVLMDVHLKGNLLGTEAAGKIRELFDIPVVYLTAHADQTTLEAAQATKPLAFLVKPIQMNTLVTHIDTALARVSQV